MASRRTWQALPRWTALALVLSFMWTPFHAQTDDEPETADYVIGVEDVLNVVVWKEPELSMSLSVRPDGKITVPLVGDIAAAGSTPEELSAALREKLAVYIREPVVSVIVQAINKFKIYVLGEVGQQGEINLTRKTRVLQAIAIAGGLSQFADKSDIILIREIDGAEMRIPIDYKKLIKGTETGQNIYVKPGDTILVN